MVLNNSQQFSNLMMGCLMNQYAGQDNKSGKLPMKERWIIQCIPHNFQIFLFCDLIIAQIILKFTKDPCIVDL
jgi:hypothetical protein